MQAPTFSPEDLQRELMNPPQHQPMYDGFDLKPQTTTPDYAAQQNHQQQNVRRPSSPSRFSVASDDSGSSIDISFSKKKGKKKATRTLKLT